MYIIGIDPGSVNGGMALRNAKGKVIAIKMPQTARDILDQLQQWKTQAGCEGQRIVCYIEDVGKGMPGQSSVATAKFARHMGHLDMALLATQIPAVYVTPQKWMKGLSLGTSKNFKTKIAWKNHIKDFTQKTYPDIKVTLWNSDALAILEYGKRME